VSERRTPDATLIEAVRILARRINTDDGVIPACLAEVAQRLAELVEERRSISTLLQKVESLEAENKRLREERRWVPVGERLPTVQGDDVLTARGPWEDGGYSISRGWWNGECWMSYGSDRDMPPVAFWQPLPPGPEGNA
jgi:hypothetical protein